MQFPIKGGVSIGDKAAPVGHGSVPIGALRGIGPALNIVKGGVVRRNHAGARAAFNAHITDGHTVGHAQTADGAAAIFKDIAGAATGPILGDNGQNDILGRHTETQFAFDIDGKGLGLHLQQTLGGQHMPHFAGANAKGERSKGTVGACVAVTADNRHPRLGHTHLRPDHMDNALDIAVNVPQGNAKVFTILA